MKKAKIWIVCFALLFSSTAGGCMSYHDADRQTYVTSMLLDVRTDGKPIIYFETFIPVRSAGKDASESSRRLFAVQGDTVSQCLYHLRRLTNFYVTLAHCKVLLISKKAVNAGVKNFFDGFIREEDFVNRTRLAVYDGDVENYRNLELSNERFTGIYLFDLLEEDFPLSVGTRADLLTFVNQCASDTHIIALPRLKIERQEVDQAPSTLWQSSLDTDLPTDPTTSQSSSGGQTSGQTASGGETGGQTSRQSANGGQTDEQASSQAPAGGETGGSGQSLSGGQSGGGQSGGQGASQPSSGGKQPGGQSPDQWTAGGQVGGQTSNQSPNNGQAGNTQPGAGSTSSGSSSSSGSSDVECEIEGIAFLDKDHLIQSLDQTRAFYYNLMNNPLHFGILEIPHPSIKGKSVTLGVLKTSKKASSSYRNGVLNYKIDINVNARFAEAQDQISLNAQTLRAVEKSTNALLQKQCTALFMESKEKNEDIFRMQEIFNKLYPREKMNHILAKTNLDVHVHTTISSTHKAYDWR